MTIKKVTASVESFTKINSELFDKIFGIFLGFNFCAINYYGATNVKMVTILIDWMIIIIIDI